MTMLGMLAIDIFLISGILEKGGNPPAPKSLFLICSIGLGVLRFRIVFRGMECWRFPARGNLPVWSFTILYVQPCVCVCMCVSTITCNEAEDVKPYRAEKPLHTDWTSMVFKQQSKKQITGLAKQRTNCSPWKCLAQSLTFLCLKFEVSFINLMIFPFSQDFGRAYTLHHSAL